LVKRKNKLQFYPLWLKQWTVGINSFQLKACTAWSLVEFGQGVKIAM